MLYSVLISIWIATNPATDPSTIDIITQPTYATIEECNKHQHITPLAKPEHQQYLAIATSCVEVDGA